jgi:2'-5' RNA ligase
VAVDPLRGGDEDTTLRAFFAIELAAPARAAAAALATRLRKRPGGDAVRWVRPESLHLTLRFLGAVAPAHTAELCRRVGAEVGRIAPLRLRLATARIFPSPRRPRVVALGVEPEAPLAGLAAAVERGVVAAGAEPEGRRFRAHLTLGRIRPGSDLPRVTAADTPDAEAFDVNEVLLYRSDLHPDGARYTALARVPLGAAGGRA